MNYQILVNKNNPLNKTYIPNDLVDANSKYRNNIKVNKEALTSFNKMKYDMHLLGYDIDIMSGYRDYSYQEKIYNRLVNEKGLNYAIRHIAPAGASEHQTGLAIDICVYKDDKCYIEHEISEFEEIKWLHNNCYKYGFIVRYPKGKEYITGYQFEPWHYRYVGIDLATYLFKNNITLEEYYQSNSKKLEKQQQNQIIFIKEAKI